MAICGVRYKVVYLKHQVDVDIGRRRNLWGQIDYWKRRIAVYVGGDQWPVERAAQGILSTLLHETIHGIMEENKLVKNLINKDDQEAFVDNMATLIADTLCRNNLIVPPQTLPKGQLRK